MIKHEAPWGPIGGVDPRDYSRRPFRIYWKTHMGTGLVQGDRIELPNGKIVVFDEKEEKINLECLEPFIGLVFEFFMDGESQGMKILTELDFINGVRCFSYDDYKEEE